MAKRTGKKKAKAAEKAKATIRKANPKPAGKAKGKGIKKTAARPSAAKKKATSRKPPAPRTKANSKSAPSKARRTATTAPTETPPVARPPARAAKAPQYATAEQMGKAQRSISISEFFAKNRHLLGFDNPRKALLTTVKEAVDNALDACEEAGILPTVEIAIAQEGETHFRVAPHQGVKPDLVRPLRNRIRNRREDEPIAGGRQLETPFALAGIGGVERGLPLARAGH